MNDLNERVSRLESANARWRMIATAAVLLASSLLFFGASASSDFDKLRAHTIWLLNPNGKPAMVLSGSDKGGTIVLESPDGKQGLMLVCNNETASFSLMKNDKPLASISENPKFGGAVSLENNSGDVGDIFAGTICFTGKDGGIGTLGVAEKSGGFLDLKDKAWRERAIKAGECWRIVWEIRLPPSPNSSACIARRAGRLHWGP